MPCPPGTYFADMVSLVHVFEGKGVFTEKRFLNH